MIVFIGGMPRSGSTFSFNVAKALLSARGTVAHKVTANVVAESLVSKADHFVAKQHGLDDESICAIYSGAIKAIVTVRRVEDAMASMFDAFRYDENTAIEFMRSWLKFFPRVALHALTLHYEEIDARPGDAILQIANYLCLDPSLPQIECIAACLSKETVSAQIADLKRDGPNTVDVGWSYFNRDTLFHKTHIAARSSELAENRMEPEKLARIREALASDATAAGLPMARLTRGL